MSFGELYEYRSERAPGPGHTPMRNAMHTYAHLHTRSHSMGHTVTYILWHMVDLGTAYGFSWYGVRLTAAVRRSSRRFFIF